MLLVWTNEAHGLIWKYWNLEDIGLLVILNLDHGWFFWAHVGCSYLILISCVFLLLCMLLGTSSFYCPQASIILAIALFPWPGNLIYILDWNPFLGLDLIFATFLTKGH